MVTVPLPATPAMLPVCPVPPAAMVSVAPVFTVTWELVSDVLPVRIRLLPLARLVVPE